MAKKKADHPRWKGGEVEPRPGDEAERAADRVEGNEPVSAEAEAERLRHGEVGIERTRRSRSADDPDEQTAEAAEEHRDHQAAEGYPPRGKL